MVFSLITATLNRTNEIDILIKSLVNQTYSKFELIIIDQNNHFEVESIVKKYDEKINIKYIRSNIRGLSVNRNIGLKHAIGEIIAFPDDDCYYKSDVLETVLNTFEKLSTNISFITLPIFDTIYPTNCYISKKGNPIIKRHNILKYCISINFFIKKKSNIIFDTNLGVGTYFSSGEETDFLWASINKEKGFYINKSGIHHIENAQQISKERAYNYGLGFGALFKKEVCHRKHRLYFIIYTYYIFRSLGGILIHPRQFNIYLNTLKGRIKGYIQFKD